VDSRILARHAGALLAADLGGATPARTAYALLAVIEAQPGGPGHHAAHAKMLTQLGTAGLCDFYEMSDEGGRMLILARLAHAGWSIERMTALFPKERTV
jgi:hypothetical protein